MSEIKSPQRKESIGDVDLQQVTNLAKEMGILDTSEIEEKEKSSEEIKQEVQPGVKEVIKVEKVVEKVVEQVPI